MATNLSPTVDIIERDLTLRIPSVTSSVGAMVVAAQKGPLNTIVNVPDGSTYIDIFGEPDDVNFTHWFTATAFLKQSNQLYVIRTENDDTLCAGVTVGLSGSLSSSDEVPASWPTPKAAKYYPMNYDYIGINNQTGLPNPDGAEAMSGGVPVFGDGEEVFHAYAIGAGPYYDGVSFVVISALDYVQLMNLREELSQAVLTTDIQNIAQKYYTGTPATTSSSQQPGNYLQNSLLKYDIIDPSDWSVDSQVLDEYTNFEFGPQVSFPNDTTYLQNDEFALLVYDPNDNLVEAYVVSKDKDKRDAQGNKMFAPDVINGNSNFIYFFIGKNPTAAGGARIISSGKVNLQGADELIGFREQKDANGDFIPGTTTSLFDLNGEIETQWREKFTNKELLDIDILLDPDYSDTLKRTLDDIAKNIRKDCFALLNMPIAKMINTITGRPLQNAYTNMKNYVQSDLNINSSYSAMYGNYFLVQDRFAEKQRWVPATGYVGAIIAKVDFNDAQWFAPAGLNRGIIDNVDQVAINPSKAQRDVMYVNRINPIVDFFGDGITIWGQKTMQAAPTAFDRINVRRLFLHMERAIEKMARYMVFELNDDFTRSRFRGVINPFLNGIQARRGITDYQVVCDETNNTPETIDANEFNCEILVKPTRVIEFIRLTFTAVPTGVSFDEVIEKR
jgi:hypothetical protein